MAVMKIEFQIVGDIAVPGADTSDLDWTGPGVASASFHEGDTFTFLAKDGDISLAFSLNALDALGLYGENQFQVTAAAPVSFQVKAEPSANCCVTVTPAGKVVDSGCTSVPSGILEIRWPVPDAPIGR
jgi:hypothetical protein